MLQECLHSCPKPKSVYLSRLLDVPHWSSACYLFRQPKVNKCVVLSILHPQPAFDTQAGAWPRRCTLTDHLETESPGAAACSLIRRWLLASVAKLHVTPCFGNVYYGIMPCNSTWPHCLILHLPRQHREEDDCHESNIHLACQHREEGDCHESASACKRAA